MNSVIVDIDLKLNQREKKVIKYLCNDFVPKLKNRLEKGNPAMFKAYNGNSCNQVAIGIAFVLNKELPKYRWIAYESIFYSSTIGRKYNHAYTIGYYKDKHILLDLEREPIWNNICLVSNEEVHCNIKNEEILSTRQYNPIETNKDIEFFTGIKGEVLFQSIYNKRR